jgi:hypothetical protein
MLCIDLCLEVVAPGDQGRIAGCKSVVKRRELRPEIAGDDPGSKQRLSLSSTCGPSIVVHIANAGKARRAARRAGLVRVADVLRTASHPKTQ